MVENPETSKKKGEKSLNKKETKKMLNESMKGLNELFKKNLEEMEDRIEVKLLNMRMEEEHRRLLQLQEEQILG